MDPKAHATGLQSLPDDLVSLVLSQLDIVSLLRACSTCRRLRNASNPAWASLCRRRWAGPLNAALFQQLPLSHSPQASSAPNWRRVFLTDNGWCCDAELPGSEWQAGGGVAAMAVHTTAAGDPVVAYASFGELHMATLAAGAGQATQKLSWQGGIDSRQAGLPTSVAVIDGGSGLVASGSWRGVIQISQLAEAGAGTKEGSQEKGTPPLAPVQPVAVWRSECRAPVMDLQYLHPSHRLLALHDGLESRGAAARDGLLRLLDVGTERCVFEGRDLFEGYQLAAAVAVDGVGHELLAASVKLADIQQEGWECLRCPYGIPASLCYHKPRASTAALCTFDTRARGVAQRFATHHRSVYPHLQPLRQHYLATSHAGTPVALWDRRNMNGPVHELQHLPSLLDDPQPRTPLPPCQQQAYNQALHLHACQDLLVGRADSGMVWLWDLTEYMGWADGTHCGSWLAGHRGGGTAGGGDSGEEGGPRGQHFDERDWDRCPLPLGCLPPPSPVNILAQGQQQQQQQQGDAALWLPRPAVWVGHNWLAGVCEAGVVDAQQGVTPWETEFEDSAGAFPNVAFWAPLTLGGQYDD